MFLPLSYVEVPTSECRILSEFVEDDVYKKLQTLS
jgi:hypothetical protein